MLYLSFVYGYVEQCLRIMKSDIGHINTIANMEKSKMASKMAAKQFEFISFLFFVHNFLAFYITFVLFLQNCS